MKNKKHKVSDPIPVDLLIDIFLRVSSKSIARFRCVSKFWRSILQRPDFTELFLTKSSSRPRLLFTFEVDKEFFVFSSPQPRNPGANSCIVATHYNAPFPKHVPSDIFNKSTMVCGLVFRPDLYERKVQIICNHATGEFVTLPNVERYTNPKAVRIEKMHFGYDPVDKQYKVLCTMTSSNTYWVLSLEIRKRLWRRFESGIHFMDNYKIRGEICINGLLYFGNKSLGSSMILCFDVRSEKFSIVNMNTNMLTEIIDQGSSTLINCKGKLGVCIGISSREFALWVLEDADNYKWSKNIFLIPPFNMLRIAGMTGEGEIVWSPHKLSNPCYVVYHNLERNTFTRVNVQGFEEFKYQEGIKLHTFVDYVENIKLYL